MHLRLLSRHYSYMAMKTNKLKNTIQNYFINLQVLGNSYAYGTK